MAAPTIYYVDTVNGNDGTGDGLAMVSAWQTLKYAIETGISADTTNGDRIRLYAPVGTPDVYSSGDPAIDLQAYLATTAAISAPLIIEGCDAAGTSRATAYITCTGRYLFNDTAFGYVKLYDLSIVGGSAVGILRVDAGLTAVRCIIQQTSSGANLQTDNSGSFLLNCAILGAGTSQYLLFFGNSNGTVVNCLIRETSNVCRGINGLSSMYNSIVHMNATNNSTGAVLGAAMTHIQNNMFLNSAAGTMGAIATGGTSMRLINNYIEGWSGTGGKPWNLTGGNTDLVVGNRWYNCTDAPSATDPNFEYDNSVLGASGIANLSTNDYTPSADLREAGFPSTFLGTSIPLSLNIGPIQNPYEAAIAGGILSHPGMNGRLNG
jgi:hypothetical protein